MDETHARQVLSWRYEGDYSFYNPRPEDFDQDLKSLTDQSNHYFAATNEDSVLVCYYCFGAEARVVGGDYSIEATDIGAGMRPDLIGKGLGARFILAGMEFGRSRLGARKYRATIASFNARALRACARIGFVSAARFRRNIDGQEFLIMVHESVNRFGKP
ncbi:MAG: N-acetyltransferase [Blastocatellia bacterium]|nr:MAG: N-acetyltransferase [Blastocatellia bacterium]